MGASRIKCQIDGTRLKYNHYSDPSGNGDSLREWKCDTCGFRYDGPESKLSQEFEKYARQIVEKWDSIPTDPEIRSKIRTYGKELRNSVKAEREKLGKITGLAKKLIQDH